MVNAASSILGWFSLVFFLALDLVTGGGGGASVSGAAQALVAKGAATTAIENIVSVKILIKNLLIHLSCFPNIALGRLEHTKLIETLPPSSDVVELCSTANFDSSNSPAVACMHAAAYNVATAFIVVVVIVCVGIVSVIVAVGFEAECYKRTSVKSTSVKSSAVEAASAHAASVSTAATSVTTTTAATSECRSWLSQADSCQCEQGYSRFPHHAPSLGRNRSQG